MVHRTGVPGGRRPTFPLFCTPLSYPSRAFHHTGRRHTDLDVETEGGADRTETCPRPKGIPK